MLKFDAVRGTLCEVFGEDVAVFCVTKFDPSADGHLPRFMESDFVTDACDWGLAWRDRMMAYGTPAYVGRAVFITEGVKLMDGCTFWLSESGEIMYTGDEDDMYVSQPEFCGGSYEEGTEWVSQLATPVI